MVIVLVIITILFFALLDYFILRKERRVKAEDEELSSPIFLTPDKALIPVSMSPQRLHHLSHTWVQPIDQSAAFVGFDDFVSFLLPGTVSITAIPKPHTRIAQGEKLWELQINGRRIPQMAPVSGEIIDINPACRMDLALPTREVQQSWIMKIRPTQYRHESRNLASPELATTVNRSLRDEITLFAHDGHLLNDGGELQSDFLTTLPEEKWNSFISKYFLRN